MGIRVGEKCHVSHYGFHFMLRKGKGFVTFTKICRDIALDTKSLPVASVSKKLKIIQIFSLD